MKKWLLALMLAFGISVIVGCAKPVDEPKKPEPKPSVTKEEPKKAEEPAKKEEPKKKPPKKDDEWLPRGR